MLATLLDRLKRAPAATMDRDAQAMIGQAVAAQPDFPYLLAQTVLIQDLALTQAPDRLAAAEESQPRGDGHQAGLGGFLGGLLGRGADRRDPYASAAPSSFSSSLGDRPPMQGSSFLASAAATAAGVAGGALLLQSIQSMFGREAVADLPQQASLAEATQAAPASDLQEPDHAVDAGDAHFGDKEFI